MSYELQNFIRSQLPNFISHELLNFGASELRQFISSEVVNFIPNPSEKYSCATAGAVYKSFKLIKPEQLK